MILQDTLLIIFLIIFGTSLIIQFFYYIYFYLRFCTYRNDEKDRINEPVSVIICARNEQENLKKFLPSVLEQDYPDYEVVVVNDCSDDDSFEVLGEFLKKYPNLKVSNITRDPKFTHNKKFAQFIGIKASKNEILLFTDADCQPVSDKWIAGMTSRFDENTSFVLGYGGYFRENGLLNKYIRYESMFIAMQYFGMALRGIPYMGVGRNLAYRKSVFFENKGFSKHSHIISGDDDLFVNANANRENTRMEFSYDSHTRSVPSSDIPTWLKMKKRHLTTAGYYKTRDKFLLVTEPVSRTLFFISAVILLSTAFLIPVVLAGLFFRLIMQTVTLSLVEKKLNESGLVFYAIIFDIFSPFINGAVCLSNLMTGSGKHIWK